jgi:hypothetical protein
MLPRGAANGAMMGRVPSASVASFMPTTSKTSARATASDHYAVTATLASDDHHAATATTRGVDTRPDPYNRRRYRRLSFSGAPQEDDAAEEPAATTTMGWTATAPSIGRALAFTGRMTAPTAAATLTTTGKATSAAPTGAITGSSSSSFVARFPYLNRPTPRPRPANDDRSDRTPSRRVDDEEFSEVGDDDDVSSSSSVSASEDDDEDKGDNEEEKKEPGVVASGGAAALDDEYYEDEDEDEDDEVTPGAAAAGTRSSSGAHVLAMIGGGIPEPRLGIYGGSGKKNEGKGLCRITLTNTKGVSRHVYCGKPSNRRAEAGTAKAAFCAQHGKSWRAGARNGIVYSHHPNGAGEWLVQKKQK